MRKCIENRKYKGLAIDKLKELGFNSVKASDSGDNVIVIFDSLENLTNLKDYIYGLTISPTTNGGAMGFLSIGKRNIKALKL